MTAKEFVLQYHPDARSERQVSGRVKGLQRTYYLIRKRGHTMWHSEGDTEAKAWKSAKERVQLELQEPKKIN